MTCIYRWRPESILSVMERVPVCAQTPTTPAEPTPPVGLVPVHDLGGNVLFYAVPGDGELTDLGGESILS